MRFFKQVLKDSKKPIINYKAIGVPEYRLPIPADREWAVSDDTNILFAQLQSNTWEMREGNYWYLLILPRQSFVIGIYAYSGTILNGEDYIDAHIEQPASFENYSFELISEIVSDAMSVLSNDNRKLLLKRQRAKSPWER
ncbi:MAG: hypothetical protein ABW170_22225 [Candidatus Thiodiazotropha sp. L084R]